MPKAKRKRFTKGAVKKQPKALKEKIARTIPELANTYENIFVFIIEGLRGDIIQDLRNQFKEDSRFLFGKNKVMAVTLGKNETDSLKPDLYKISEHLKGESGLLFTNRKKEEVIQYFQKFHARSYARGGFKATQTVELKEGPLEQFQHSMEPHLRKLGLPTEIKEGIIRLRHDYIVCKEGDIISPETARILKLLGIQMAECTVFLKGFWSNNKFKPCEIEK
eukprot:TRINITY_DN872_c0_g1_i2.p1 TRINITY_DN872_c0_g1~~TRINITY_DN872_c0_g1_i2.p1  ORF type:complete len:221 (-),score=34.54 TRINITY_DN872_c0_g1_i2:53-715(-)